MSEETPQISGEEIVKEGARLSEELMQREAIWVPEDVPGWKSRDRAKMSLVAETQEKQLELVNQAVMALASELHETWRKTRLKEDGSFEPRVKATKDEAWIVEHGTDQVDIANTKYEDLPSDWQAENKAASGVIVGIMIERNGQISLEDAEQRNEIGSAIHEAWLARNEWAKGGELDVPFDQLPPEEQAKDIDQLIIAQQIFSF